LDRDAFSEVLMISISSVSAIPSGAPNTLTLTRGQRSRSYELTFDSQVVGVMERPSFWSPSCVVETADGRWIFRPSGCFGGIAIVDEASQRTIAMMKSNWGTGGGTLTFTDGQKFELTVSGLWQPVWSLTPENGQSVVRLNVREKTLELPSGAAVKDLSLLAMFVYYRLLKSEEDAAMAVLVAAVS
jgi:hypothetical protein